MKSFPLPYVGTFGLSEKNDMALTALQLKGFNIPRMQFYAWANKVAATRPAGMSKRRVFNLFLEECIKDLENAPLPVAA